MVVDGDARLEEGRGSSLDAAWGGPSLVSLDPPASPLLPASEASEEPALAPGLPGAAPRAPPATAARRATAVVELAKGARWSEESGHAGGLVGGGKAEEARRDGRRREQRPEMRKWGMTKWRNESPEYY